MTSLRIFAGSWLALALLGCADSGLNLDDSDDVGDGDGDIDEPLPENDAELHCADSVAPLLKPIGPTVGPIAVGPCGHVAYHDDEGQGWLIEPDGFPNEFDHAPHRVVFAATGDMMAWEADISGGLMFNDMIGGEPTLLTANHAEFGFVPSFFDSSHPSWLWTCIDGKIERHDRSVSDFVALAVVCESVVASTGSPRLTFADDEGRVWIYDLDTDDLVETEDLDWVGHDGSKRDDTLWIDHDGEIVHHVAIEWQGDSDVDSEWPIELWDRVLDRQGAVILDEESLSLRQAPRRGAPVFVFQQGTLRRLDAGAPSSVAGGIGSAELAASGELFYETESDDVRAAELPLELPPTAIGQFTTPVELRPSGSAAMLGLEHHSDICIVDDLGECDRILLALRLWDRDAGLDPRVLLSSSPWNLEATLDDGSMLVVGAPVEAEGPTYAGEQPPPRVLWIDREGEIRAELPAGNGDLAVRQTFELAGDRVLFEYQGESGVGELMLAGFGDFGFVSLIAGVDVALLQAWVDARAERIVFVAENQGASAGTLWLGGLPQ